MRRLRMTTRLAALVGATVLGLLRRGSGTTRSAVAPAGPAAGPTERPPDESTSGATPSGRTSTDGSPAGQTLTVIGSIVAPTTFVTGLLFYFGWSHAYWFFHYFGVDSSGLGLTTSDYLLRSVDGLFVPTVVIAAVATVAVFVHAAIDARLVRTGRRRAVTVTAVCATVLGTALTILGLLGVFGLTVPIYFALRPLTLGAGVLLLVYAGRLGAHRRAEGPAPREPVAIRVAVLVLTGLSLFWAATDYSAAVGTSRAQQVVAELPASPEVAVLSSQSLGIRLDGVRRVACQEPDAGYRYRYEGLRLVVVAGNQYVFLPARWRADPVAVVLPRSDAIRLEYRAPSRASSVSGPPRGC